MAFHFVLVYSGHFTECGYQRFHLISPSYYLNRFKSGICISAVLCKMAKLNLKGRVL